MQRMPPRPAQKNSSAPNWWPARRQRRARKRRNRNTRKSLLRHITHPGSSGESETRISPLITTKKNVPGKTKTP
jgi:hypothetical protein